MDPAAAIAASAFASFGLAGLLVLTAPSHGRFSMDAPGAIQKTHLEPTPRIGGIGIYLALLMAARLLEAGEVRQILDVVLLAGAPAMLSGLLEDLTKRVGVAARLLATLGSGLLACAMSGVALAAVGVPLMDDLLTFAPLAVLFTAFAVAGVANAINIIDGFHGLASGTTVIALLALALIAAQAGDPSLATAALLTGAAVAGFWLINFPWGKLFLGDGGAYFAGFALAWLAVLLPTRNPEVSPWASLLVCAYPVIEVVYSILRRRRSARSPGAPDRAHLHSLVGARIVQRHLRHLAPPLQNAAVSVLMWAGALLPGLAAVAFYRHTGGLVLCMAACVLLYHRLYRRVARS